MNRRRLAVIAISGLALFTSACVSRTVKRVNVTPAEHAEREIPADELLDVSIAVFDSGLPEIEKADPEPGVFPAVRRAEARIVPTVLRQTLQNTGQWGAVRVVPAPAPGTELLVTGTILESNGVRLAVKIRASDATGRVWLEREYREEAASLSYTESASFRLDPFQDLYNRIANDLLQERRRLDSASRREVRRVASLRFSADLAPDAFAAYLDASGERFRAVGLPAREDPNVARIAAIRQRDYGLVDALDQHYEIFESRTAPAYDEWRAASYREIESLEKLQSEALKRKVIGAAAIAAGIAAAVVGGTGSGAAATVGVLGGVAVLKSGFDKSSESEIHAEAIEELGGSLEADLQPQILDLEGETVTLSGSAEEQYGEWRDLLRDIYVKETGFPVASGEPAPQ